VPLSGEIPDQGCSESGAHTLVLAFTAELLIHFSELGEDLVGQNVIRWPLTKHRLRSPTTMLIGHEPMLECWELLLATELLLSRLLQEPSLKVFVLYIFTATCFGKKYKV
jgi:hypothetical protein